MWPTSSSARSQHSESSGADPVKESHLRWFARTFGRAEYPPLTADDLAYLADVVEAVEYEAGDLLYREGDEGDAVFVILWGTVYLRRGTPEPGHVVAHVDAGSALGDAEAVFDTAYRSTAQAFSDVLALRIRRAELLAMLAARPRIALRWLGATFDTREAARSRVDQMHHNVEARLCDSLLQLGDENGLVYRTHQQLADLIGARRETVSRGLARIRERGVIETGPGWMRVLDRERAGAIADAR